MVVNHARFLAFPDRERLPYLASRDFYREHGKPRQLFPRPPRHPPRPCTCGRTRTACAARPETPLGRAKVACDVRRRVAIIGRWLSEQEPAAIARLAVDGKTLRGSGRRDGKALQIFSAVTHRLRMTLQQLPIGEKTNEIPSFKPLLRAVQPPPGTLVTADAMHCQQESARCVVEEFGGTNSSGSRATRTGY